MGAVVVIGTSCRRGESALRAEAVGGGCRDSVADRTDAAPSDDPSQFDAAPELMTWIGRCRLWFAGSGG